MRRVLPFYENRFISLSDKSLSILDIFDRDNPSSISELRLERRVEGIIGDGNTVLLLVDTNFLMPFSFHPEEIRSYYIYEMVDAKNPVSKPFVNLLSYEPVVWMKGLDSERVVLKTQDLESTTFYLLKVKEKIVEGCVCIGDFVSISEPYYNGEKIVQSGIFGLGFLDVYPYLPKGDFLALLIKPDNLSLENALFVEGITSFEKGNYAYGMTDVNGFIGADSKSLYFSARKIEMNESEEKIFPYLIKIDISSLPSFKKEMINLPEIPKFFLGGNRFLTQGENTISFYEVFPTTSSIFTMKNELISSELYRTENYILNRGYSPETYKSVFISYRIGDKNLKEISRLEIDKSSYGFLPLFYNYFSFGYEDVRWISGDFIILDGVLSFEDPSAIRKNKYCLDPFTCWGTIYGALILKADKLSLEDSIPITTSLYNTSIFYTEDNLLVPRGLMGMDFIEVGKK